MHCEDVDEIRLVKDRGLVAGYCTQGNESFDFMKFGKFLDYLSD
jgi:hypothetical protein